MTLSNAEQSSVFLSNRIKARSFKLNKLAFGLVVCLFSAPFAFSSSAKPEHSVNNQQIAKKPPGLIVSQKPPFRKPKIQVAILLDTSGSMDGLIDQTRNQLWQVVNEFSTAKRNGMTPTLEVALFEYGNDGNSKDKGFVRKLNNFTQELDRVSEGLFSLTTNGGSEYCGFAIKTAVESLQWSNSAKDIKTIFIAGNEAFTQGPIHYQKAVQLAQQHGISVNTIFAGAHNEGLRTGWQSGALMAGGDYMSIDADQQIVHIDAPQDKRIAELNRELNQTYIPYGVTGSRSAMRQMEQDAESSKISAGLLAKRAKSKSSSFYRNSSWDLVDAMEDGAVAEEQLAEMEEKSLPEPMKKLSAKERKAYVAEKSQKRKAIKKEIAELSKKRDVYVAKKKKEAVAAAPSVSDALTKAVKKQATAKKFKFEEQ